MLKELFSELFEKLKTESRNNSTSKSGCFNFFEIHILEGKYQKVNFVSSRSLTNYYNKYVEEVANTAGEPNGELKDLIALYLGFDSYLDFENSLVKPEKQSIVKPAKNALSTKNTWIAFSAFIIFILGVIYFVNTNFYSEKNCIIWTETYFVESPCDVKYSIDNTRYQLNIDAFKKIKVDKETAFFKDEKAVVWYGKSKSGEMEYFTLRGVHPETLKELKPITAYIIKKYVFNMESSTSNIK
jgi:hypothetical protein